MNAPPDAGAVRICDVVRKDMGIKGNLVIWGWMPAIYVVDGMGSGTCHAICHFLYGHTARAQFMRETFIQDIQASRPGAILDASGGGVDSLFNAFDASHFPELWGILKAQYVLAGVVPLTDFGYSVRIYRRRSL